MRSVRAYRALLPSSVSAQYPILLQMILLQRHCKSRLRLPQDSSYIRRGPSICEVMAARRRVSICLYYFLLLMVVTISFV